MVVWNSDMELVFLVVVLLTYSWPLIPLMDCLPYLTLPSTLSRTSTVTGREWICVPSLRRGCDWQIRILEAIKKKQHRSEKENVDNKTKRRKIQLFDCIKRLQGQLKTVTYQKGIGAHLRRAGVLCWSTMLPDQCIAMYLSILHTF